MKNIKNVVVLPIVLFAQAGLLVANVPQPKTVSAVTTTVAPVMKSDIDSAPIKEVYVEAQVVMVSSDAGQEVQKELKAAQESSLKKVQQAEQEYVKAQKDFANKASTMSAEAQDKEQKKLAKMKRDGEAVLQEVKEELQLEMYKKTEVLDKELIEAAQEFAKENGFDVVKDKASGRPLYVAERLDVTDKLTQKMNVRHQAKNKKTLKLTNIAA